MFEAHKSRLVQFLRWVERYTKTDMVYLFKGGSWLTLGQILSICISLAVSVVFANFVSKDTYGFYKYILSIMSIFTLFALPGMAGALPRAVAQGYEGSMRSGLAASIRYGCIGTAVGLAAAGYYVVHGNMQIALAFVIMAIFIPVFDPFTNVSSYFIGRADFKGSVVVNTITQAGSALAVILTILMGGGVFALLLSYFGSYSLLYIACYAYVLKQIPRDAPIDVRAIPYAKHLSVMSALGLFANNVDKLVLFHTLGPVEVAVYTVATAAPDQLKSVLGFLTTLFFPTLARESEAEVRHKMLSRFVFFFCISALGILTYIVLAPIFFHIVFRQYESYVHISQLFSISLLTISFDPALIFLSSHGKIKEQYWSTTIGNLLQIGGIVALGIPYGLMGVIVARGVIRFLSNGLNVYFFYKPLSPIEPQTQ